MSNAGKRVKVHYTGTLDDGSVFDSSYQRDQPLGFVCASGQMIPGFDKAVEEMEVGETRTIHVTPDEAYGPYIEDGIQRAPLGAIPGTEGLKVGDQVSLQGKDGRPYPAKVAEITDVDIAFDMNHPLAGKDLTFQITLLESADTETGVHPHHH